MTHLTEMWPSYNVISVNKGQIMFQQNTGIYYVIENIRTKANMAKTNLDGSDVGRVLLVVVVVGLEVVVVGSSLRTA